MFDQLDAETFIGFTPFPGTERVLSSHDIFLAGARYGLFFPPGAPAPSVCVRRAVRRLSAEEVRSALMTALGVPDIQLEILEISSQLVPPGQLDFRHEELNRPRNGNPQVPVIWRGRLIFDGRHGLAVWARVRMAVNRESTVAAEEIPVGSVIRSNQVRIVSGLQFPTFESSLNSPSSVGQIVGKRARRALALGERITTGVLEDPKDVFRGETVRVHVVDGGTTITLDGIAQSSGNKGETIVVHNPSSGKNFRGVIEEQREVVVHPTTGAAL
jgi:flagella basal body P-ring formation protein FlgA